MAKTSGGNRNQRAKLAPVSVKEIYNEISYLNPSVSTVSSLGSYISQSSQMVSDSVYKEVISYLPKDSTAHKIMMSASKTYSDKQLWTIAYELQKNKKYSQKIAKDIAERKIKAKAKHEASKTKLQVNKSGSQHVLDSVKSSGFKLGDYYTWLKSNKKYKKEYYNKKYSSDSANEFIKQKGG